MATDLDPEVNEIVSVVLAVPKAVSSEGSICTTNWVAEDDLSFFTGIDTFLLLSGFVSTTDSTGRRLVPTMVKGFGALSFEKSKDVGEELDAVGTGVLGEVLPGVLAFCAVPV